MRVRVTRAAFIIAAASIAWFAVRRDAPVAPRPADLFDQEAPRAVVSWTRPDTLGRGETLDVLLRRGGLDGASILQVVDATPSLNPRRLQAGMPVEFVSMADTLPPHEIVLKLGIDHLLRVTRADDGTWNASEEFLPWITDTVVVQGSVNANLYDALGSAANDLFPGPSHESLVLGVADVYKYRVDMSRELRQGDSVYALVERARGPESSTRVTRVIASKLFVAGRLIEAYYFPDPDGRTKYYDAGGKSLATAFLRSPIDFARITSGFGSRYHPILKIRRPHEGVDYGARAGTPVRAIGDGTVRRALYNPGGYGNLVEIQHPNGFISRYAHLSKFDARARSGGRVHQGDIVGYVGMTGLATAPHLHFEILQGGRATSPTVALRNVDGTPLPSARRPAFDLLRGRLVAMLGRGEGVVRYYADE